MGLFDRIRSAFRDPPALALPESVDAPTVEATATSVAKASTPITEAPGVPGFSVYGGHLQSGESRGEMTGAARWTLDASTKRNVGIVGSILRRFTEFVGAPTWKVPPASSSPEDVERAAFAQRQLDNLATSWRTVVQTACMSRFDGAAIQVWSARPLPDGRVGLADVVSRPMHTIERWDISPDGAVRGVWQRGPDGAEYRIDRERMVYTLDIPISNSPAGVGLMRQIAEPVRELGEYRKMLAQGLETDLSGIPVIHAPIERLRKQINKEVGGRVYTEADFKRDITGSIDLISNPVKGKRTGVVLDSTPHPALNGEQSTGARQYELQLLSAGGRAHEVVAARIAAIMWEIAIVLGGEYLLLGQGGGGSLAMAQAKTLDFYRLIIGALNGFAEVAQRDILRPLWALNGWEPETAPKPTFDKLEFMDVVAVMTGLLPALSAGGIPLDRRDLELVNKLLGHLGLPEIHEHEGDLMIGGGRDQLAEDLGLDKPTATDPLGDINRGDQPGKA